MELTIQAGKTSQRIAVWLQDSAAGDGSGKTGLTNATSGLACYYWRSDEGNAGATSVSLASATRGSYTSGGFKEKDASNQPGMYEFGIPDAAIATGADWVIIVFTGSTPGIVPRTVLIQLAPPPVFAKNTAITAFTFPLCDSGGVAVTGATVTAKRSIDGGTLSACANSVTEISGGLYKITLAAADLNGNVIALNFTAAGAIDVNFTLVMQATTP